MRKDFVVSTRDACIEAMKKEALTDRGPTLSLTPIGTTFCAYESNPTTRGEVGTSVLSSMIKVWFVVVRLSG